MCAPSAVWRVSRGSPRPPCGDRENPTVVADSLNKGGASPPSTNVKHRNSARGLRSTSAINERRIKRSLKRNLARKRQKTKSLNRGSGSGVRPGRPANFQTLQGNMSSLFKHQGNQKCSKAQRHHTLYDKEPNRQNDNTRNTQRRNHKRKRQEALNIYLWWHSRRCNSPWYGNHYEQN